MAFYVDLLGMDLSTSIDMIFKAACRKMSIAEANAYVGMTVTFILNQLKDKEGYSVEKFEQMLKEEALFHQQF